MVCQVDPPSESVRFAMGGKGCCSTAFMPVVVHRRPVELRRGVRCFATFTVSACLPSSLALYIVDIFLTLGNIRFEPIGNLRYSDIGALPLVFPAIAVWAKLKTDLDVSLWHFPEAPILRMTLVTQGTGNMMKQAGAGMMLSILLANSFSALADEPERFRRGHWEGREIHRFGDRDLYIWRGGHWRHGWHRGRLGWWWIAAGVWYFYPRPVYPYPNPYTPPVAIMNPQSVPVQPQQAAQLWYYCDSSREYFPYAPNCPEGWRTVPAMPPQAEPH